MRAQEERTVELTLSLRPPFSGYGESVGWEIPHMNNTTLDEFEEALDDLVELFGGHFTD